MTLDMMAAHQVLEEVAVALEVLEVQYQILQQVVLEVSVHHIV
jgi:hypothetical protein